MLDKLVFDLFLLVLVLIGMACALLPLYIHINDKINDKFKDS
mgnify:CR=1 FL=1|jgi:hypothetical protein